MTRVRNATRSLRRAAHACRAVEALEKRVLLSDTVSLVRDINDASVGPYPAGSHGPVTISWDSNPAPGGLKT